jgi:uncharacterized membrane protein YidH (DUF202 family)
MKKLLLTKKNFSLKKILSAVFFIGLCSVAISGTGLIAYSVKAVGLQDAFGSSSTLKTVGDRAEYNTTGDVNLTTTISNIISIFLSILGIVFIGLLIYGGVNWMTAGGQENRVEEAKMTIKQSIIGLIIVVSAYAVSFLVIKALSSIAG